MKPAAPAPVVEATTLRRTRAASCARAAATTCCWTASRCARRASTSSHSVSSGPAAAKLWASAGIAGSSVGSSPSSAAHSAASMSSPTSSSVASSSGIPMSAVPASARNSGAGRRGRRLDATRLVGGDVALAGRRAQRGLVLAGERLVELSVAGLVVCVHVKLPLSVLNGRMAAAHSRGLATARPGGGGGTRRSPPRTGRGRSPCACCPRSSRRRPWRPPRRCRRGWRRR